MRKKVIMFIIFAVVFLFIGKLILFPKDINKSVNKILQKKAEQFYENQEGFEKIVAYVNELDFRSIIENNEMWTDVIIDGITFSLEDGGNDYGLSLYSAKTLLSQLMNCDENTLISDIIGESSSIHIWYDKESYNNVTIVFSIEDSRLEYVMARLVWHNSDYEPSADWIYQLNENWTIIALGLDRVK